MRAAFSMIIVALAAMPATAHAEPTESEQRTACMADAVRLCFWYIPNREKITSCMAAKRDQLSQGCRVVFDASSGPGKPPH